MKKRTLKNIFRGFISAPFLMLLMYNFYLVTIHLKKAPIGEWAIIIFYIICIFIMWSIIRKKKDDE